MPGEIAACTMRERMQSGIPLPEAVVDDLNALAERLGVAERL